MLIMSDLIHCIDTHLWVHCGTLRQNWWIPLESNLTKKQYKFSLYVAWNLTIQESVGLHILPPPNKEKNIEPGSDVWYNPSNASDATS